MPLAIKDLKIMKVDPNLILIGRNKKGCVYWVKKSPEELVDFGIDSELADLVINEAYDLSLILSVPETINSGGLYDDTITKIT